MTPEQIKAAVLKDYVELEQQVKALNLKLE